VVLANNELDKEFVEKQRERLEELRVDLARMVEGLEEDQQDRAESEGDMTENDSGDMSHSLFTRELDADGSSRRRERLRNVERALAEDRRGTYGICDDTGEPIPRGRLEAMPEAIYTVEAQQRRERERRPPL
jgi:DnaK suppressor protein